MTTTKRISELQSISNVELDSVFVVVQDGTTHKVSYDTILLQSRANDWLTLDAVLNDSTKLFGKSLLPSANEYFSLGSLAERWNDLYLSNSTIYLGDATISAQGTSLVLSEGARVGEVEVLANDWATWNSAVSLAYSNDWATWVDAVSLAHSNDWATWSNVVVSSYANDWATWSNLSENSYATWSNLNANDYATWSNLSANDYATWSNLSENSYATWSNLNANDWATWSNLTANDYATWSNLSENLYATWSNLNANDYATWSNLSENLYATWSNLNANDYATWSNLNENLYATWSNLSENSYATWSNLSENLYATWSNLSENIYSTWANLSANDYATWSNLSENSYATWSNLSANDYATWVSATGSAYANDWLTLDAILNDTQTMFGRDKTFLANIYVYGNLYVFGNTFQANVGTLLVQDNTINLNFGGTTVSAENSGIHVEGDGHTIVGSLHYRSDSRSGWRVGFGDLSISSSSADDIARFGDMDTNSYATWSNLNANDYATWSNLSENSYATWSNLSENIYATWANLSENSYATWSNLSENVYATWSNLSENIYATWSNLQVSYRLHGNLISVGTSNLDFVGVGVNVYFTDGNLTVNISGGASTEQAFANDYATYTNLISNSAVYITDNVVPQLGEGFLWWNSSDGILYIRYVDGDSSQWVPVVAPVSAGTDTSKALSKEEGATSRLYPLLVDALGISSDIKSNSQQLYYNSFRGELTVTNSNTSYQTVGVISYSGSDVKRANIVNSGISGTINFDILSYCSRYFTSSATENSAINFRASASKTLNSVMSTGEDLTLQAYITVGAPAYIFNQTQIDGVAQTVKWFSGDPGTPANNSVDLYTYNIFKTGDEAFTVLAKRESYF